MNEPYGNSEFNLSKSFATDINVATKMAFAGGSADEALVCCLVRGSK